MTGLVYSCQASDLVANSVTQLISEIKTSGLRGRGGAGFPSGMKWVWEWYLDLVLVHLLTTTVVHELQGLGQGHKAPVPSG